MARKFLTHIDLAKNELQNAVIQQLASAPASPVQGQLYYNTTDDNLYIWDGAAWVDLTVQGGGGGDASTNTATSVDNEIALFSSTTGKLLKRATITGLAKLTSGVLSAAVAGTDYSTPSSTDTLTNKTFNANGTGNSISNLETADFATNVIDNDAAMVANSATRIATQQATKSYIDNAVQGLSWKQTVRLATTANGALATAFANGQTIDGVVLATGDRILLKDQTAPAENGIYTVNASGAPTRATDADSSGELVNATVYVSAGTANADTVWTCTTNATITVGTTGLVFAQVNGGSVPTASTSVQGKVQLATQAEAQAKTDNAKALTAASVADFTRKFTGLIGDGTATSYPVTHGLGSQYVTAQAYDASTNAQVECDIVLTSATQVTFSFATAPASNAIRVVIVG